MDKPKVNITFHNPNTSEDFTNFLIKFIPEITYNSKVYEEILEKV